MDRVASLLLLVTLLVVGIFSLMPNSGVIGLYFRLWGALGLDPGKFGDNYMYISRAGHLLAYGILTVLLIAVKRSSPYACTIGAVSIAALLELSQFATASRHPHLVDFAFSALGAIVGLSSCQIARYK